MGSNALPPAVKTHIIIATLPFYGHVRPLRSLATSLAALGYQITFIAGPYQKASIEAIQGAEFVPLKGGRKFDPADMNADFPGRPDDKNMFWDLERIFVGLMHDQFDTLREILEQKERVGKKVVLIQDGSWVGSCPMLLCSPHMNRIPTIGIGHYPLMVLSKDTPPFGAGLPYQGEEVNKQMNAGCIQMFSGVQAAFKKQLERYDCQTELPSEFLFDTCVRLPDLYLQLCPPVLEPLRTDLPTNVRFCGTLTGSNDKKPRPKWWDEFVAQESEKPLIIVTSGSLPGLKADYLIRPAIEACRNLPVRLVVCAVNVPFPDDLVLPKNTRWEKWIAFEDIFPYTSLIVSSGGYGGISQAFASGIPMIVAGTTEDKTETGLRAEGTGAAINLRTQTPSIEQLSEALNAMLTDPKYKTAALQLKKAYADCDALESIVKGIEELTEQYYDEDPSKRWDSGMQTPAETVAGAQDVFTVG